MNASLVGRRYLSIALTVVAALTAPSAAGAQLPPMPRVRSEPCDGYCQPTWATCRRAALRAAPDVDARVVARLDSGQLAHVIDGRRITTRPGIVVVRRTHTLVQRLSGADGDVPLEHPKRWRLIRGDTVYVVDRETDGDSYRNYIWVRRGQEDTTAAFWDDPEVMTSPPTRSANVRLLAPMEQTWWARVRTTTGLTGWTAAGDEWSGRSYYDDPASKCVPGAPAR
jgi:hypothetical protein